MKYFCEKYGFRSGLTGVLRQEPKVKRNAGLGDWLGERLPDCNCPEPRVHRPLRRAPVVTAMPHPHDHSGLRSLLTC